MAIIVKIKYCKLVKEYPLKKYIGIEIMSPILKIFTKTLSIEHKIGIRSKLHSALSNFRNQC